MKKKIIGLIIVAIIIGVNVNEYMEKRQRTVPVMQNYTMQNQVPATQQLSSPVVSSESESTGVQQTICPSCHGSGSCTICNGTGYYSNYGFRSPCNACDDYRDEVDSDGNRPGNGVCSTCHGARFVQ